MPTPSIRSIRSDHVDSTHSCCLGWRGANGASRLCLFHDLSGCTSTKGGYQVKYMGFTLHKIETPSEDGGNLLKTAASAKVEVQKACIHLL